MKKNIVFIFSLLLLIFCSCSDTLEIDKKREKTDYIRCNVSLQNEPLSKGSLINSSSSDGFTEIGVFAYQTTSSFSASSVPAECYYDNDFSNKLIQKNSQEVWQLDKTYYWPQSSYLSFFAYAPYVTTPTNGVTLNIASGSIPTITYEMPNAVADQPDLLIAVPEIDLNHEVADLKFAHALASIAVIVTGPDLVIDSVWVTNISTKGTISLNYNGTSMEWQDLNDPSSEPYRIGLIPDAEAVDSITNIMATDGYLMVIPQELSDSAYIMIKFQDVDVKQVPLKTSTISSWEAGQIYTYELKHGEYNFIVTPDTTQCSYLGGTFNLSITSQYTAVDQTARDLGWTVSIDNISDTTWLQGYSTLSGDGGLNLSRQFNLQLSPYTSSLANSYDQDLQQAATIGYDDLRNIAEYNDSLYTSNCYLISHPGWFQFPAYVMGNGISGVPASNPTINNEDCFPSTAPYFVDYAGNEITKLSDLQIPIDASCSVEVLWMDAPELLTNVELTTDQNIQFYVSPNSIRQGNAIIGIKNGSGDIMWSWHIWVTPIRLITTEAKDTTNIFYFNLNIGECLESSYVYQSREVSLTFTQNESNISKTITFNQLKDSIFIDYSSLYFQYGRKDPSPGASKGSTVKPLFGTTFYSISPTTTPVTVQEAIANPTVFYPSTESWYSNDIYTLWFIADGYGYKTLYDPSPSLFKVPIERAYGHLVVNNGWYVYKGFGTYNFKYSNGSDSEEIDLTLTANGYVNGSTGVITENGSTGNYWSAIDVSTANTDNEATSFKFNYSMIDNFVSHSNKAMGFTICPIQDMNASQ